MTATNHSDASNDESGSIVSSRYAPDADVDDPLGTIFSLLSNERSRLVLAWLAETNERVFAFETLVDRVASIERGEGEPGSETHRRRIATNLHHSVLPKLAGAGAIDYDSADETIRYRPKPPLETTMERIADIESALDSPVPLETWLRLFASRRRRDAAAVLHEHGESLTLADVADEVAVREHETAITEIPADDVLQVYFSLYHTHVPKLVDAGVVEYDQEADTITPLDHDLLSRCAVFFD